MYHSRTMLVPLLFKRIRLAELSAIGQAADLTASRLVLSPAVVPPDLSCLVEIWAKAEGFK